MNNRIALLVMVIITYLFIDYSVKSGSEKCIGIVSEPV